MAEGARPGTPEATGLAGHGPLEPAGDFEEVLLFRLQQLQRQLLADFQRATVGRDRSSFAPEGLSLARAHSWPPAQPVAAAALGKAVAASSSAPCGDVNALVCRQPGRSEEADDELAAGSLGERMRATGSETGPCIPVEQFGKVQEGEGEEEAGKPATATYARRSFFMDEGQRPASWQPPRWQTTPPPTLLSRSLTTFRSKYVIPPNSPYNSAFELAGVVAMGYDAVMTPWIVAWAPAWFGYSVISAGLLAFWVLDMILSFFRGYYSNGEAVVQHGRIALHYIRTWFVVDLAINIADSISMGTEFAPISDSGRGGFFAMAPAVLRMSHLLRLLRLLRLVRLLKVGNIVLAVCASWGLQDKRRRLASGLQSIKLGAKLVITLLWVNHLTCCLWFFIGTNGLSDTGYSWLDVQPPSLATSYRDASPLFQYASSLHWCLTQMTPGSMKLVPQNSLETVFNIGCLFIGLFAGALLVSQLSARIVKVKLETQEESARLAKLHTYLREHEVSWQLRERVRDQIHHRLACDSRLTAKDVDLLKHLSLSLRRELNWECFGRHLMSHTLFHAWGVMEPALVEAMCLHAVELLCLAKDEDLFTSHTVPDKTYLVLKGALQYSLDFARDGEQSAWSATVCEGTWVSEAALWLECSYSGTLTSRTQCELLALDVPVLLDLLKKFPSVRAVNHHYCAAFHEVFAASHPGEGRDLAVNCEQQVLIAMPKQWRLAVMLPVLDSAGDCQGGHGLRMLQFGRARSRCPTDELKLELTAGKAIISLDKGALTRTVLLVTLRLELDETRQILVRLAKEGDKGRFVGAAALPGTKIRQGETAQQAIGRVIDNMCFQGAQLKITGSVPSSETTISRRLGICSKYFITNFHATASSDNIPANARPCQAAPVRYAHRNSLLGGILGLSTEETEERAALANCRGFLLANSDGELALYSWMSETTYAHLRTAQGQEMLHAWVAANAGKLPNARRPDACGAQPCGSASESDHSERSERSI